MEQNQTLFSTDQTDADRLAQENLCARGNLPAHVAIIMDGNGRWAKERGQLRIVGHNQGAIAVRDVTEACAQLGIRYLTLYTFSTENWNRPSGEVNALMQLLIRTLRKERDTLIKNNIRLQSIGDVSKLPNVARRELEETIESTADTDRMTLVLALSYSGRWDIVQAARELGRRIREGKLAPEQIDEALFEHALSTADMPDPDLLIRTGGDLRISNFLLWQLAYTEFYITDVFWPAFRRSHLYEAIRVYQNRDRRFGRIPTEAPS